MSIRSTQRFALALVALVALVWSLPAEAEPPAARANPAAAAAVPPSTDAERKAEILNSECWQRAMFELTAWFKAQRVYPPEQVASIKAEFAARVDRMSAAELQFVLNDLEAKFRILNTPESREVRAWLGNYLSILTDRGRDDLLKNIPDFNSMNSIKLQQTIDQLALRRDSRARQNTKVQQLHGSATNPWNQGNPPAARPAARSAYRSPYRPNSKERPFDNVQVGTRRTMTVGPNGQWWLNVGFY